MPKLDASVSATVNELELASPSLIGADVLRSASSTISTELRLVGDRGFLDRLSVTSDLGQADLSARVTVSEFLSSVAASNWLDVLRGHDMHSSGQIGLAQVARTFPELLRMREDIELRSGQIEWNVTSRANAENQRHWQGQLGTADLQIVRDGRPLALRLPVSVTFSAQDTTEGVTLDRLAVESDFLQLAGRGRLAEGELELHGDLARLASELAQVVDLGDVQLRGQMDATARWQTAASQTNMEGRFTLADFEFASPGRDVWNEQKLVVGISGQGSYRDDALREISQANVFVESGADRLQVQLTHAVAENFAEAAWPLHCQLAGELATWQRRVEPFYPLAGWSLAGNTNASADARVSRALVEIESAAAEVHQFQVAGGSLSIKEPTVKLSTTGSWNQTQQQWVSARTTLATSAVSIGATDLSVNLQPTPAASGAIGYQGDLGRLSKWLADSEWALGNGISGQFSGQLRLAYEDGVTRFRASSNVQDVSLHELPSQSITRHVSLGSTPAKPLWHEPRVTIAASGGYLAREDRIEFSQVDVAAAPLQISGRGFATELTTRPTVDVTGSMDYDLAVLAERFRGYLGDQIAINGRNKRDFVVRGPLLVASSSADVNTQPQASGSLSPANAVVSNELHAATGIEWSSAEVYGIPIGPGQLSGALSRGTIQIEPLSLSAGSGRLTLAPQLSLNSQPMLLTAEPGSLMEQIEITPEMCNTWLKFVAPLLADATRAEGSFSAHLAGARIPVMEPASGEVGGTLIIHEARMGPGPLAQQFLGLAQQVKDILRRRPGSSQIVDSSQPWVYLGPQQVAFQMADGRVYHRDLQMQIDDVIIRTRGSVGMDESVSLVAEIPVLDKWIDGERALAGLRGQVLTVPISGTLSRPQLDQRAITRLSGQLVRRAAEGYLRDEVQNQLQKQLNKLFD